MAEEKKKAKLEIVKENSRFLRGTIAEELARDTPNVSSDNTGLLKLHGTYQQDDRDARKQRAAGAGNRRNKSCVPFVPLPLCSASRNVYAAQSRRVDDQPYLDDYQHLVVPSAPWRRRLIHFRTQHVSLTYIVSIYFRLSDFGADFAEDDRPLVPRPS